MGPNGLVVHHGRDGESTVDIGSWPLLSQGWTSPVFIRRSTVDAISLFVCSWELHRGSRFFSLDNERQNESSKSNILHWLQFSDWKNLFFQFS